MNDNRLPRTSLPGYYREVSNRLRAQVNQLTQVIVHSGEMGSNDQQWFSKLLAEYLPKRIGVETGFVVNAASDQKSAEYFSTGMPRNQDQSIGPQSDILLVDVMDNAPLCSEQAFKVFPIEMVLATIEVTRDLDGEKLQSDLKKVARVRALADNKNYSDVHDENAYTRRPLGYVVGLEGDLSAKTVIDKVSELEDHLRPNAILSLDKALFTRTPYKLEFNRITEDVLFHFISMLRYQVESFPRGTTNLRAYVPAVAERCWIDEEGELSSETLDEDDDDGDFETSGMSMWPT